MRVTLCKLGFVSIVLTTASIASAQPDAPEPLPSDDGSLPSSMHCPVEGHEVRDRQYGVLWNGRRYYLGTELCQEKFLEDPEYYAREIEPRAALFRSQNPSSPSMGAPMLALSVLFVVGLVAGGFSSYVAVQKGYSGVHWFAYGVLLNVLAVFAIARKEPRPVGFRRDGLAKMPVTHAPVPCESCGRENHPAAAQCSGCGRALSPTVEGDTARL